jgi:hypothetical protein
MSWQLRTIAEIKVSDSDMPEDTIMISGQLHGPHRCTCPQCMALESTAVMVAELLRPGESRQIAIPDSPLFLTVRRHRPVEPTQPVSPRFGRSRLGTGFRQGANIAQPGRGGISLFLKR